MTVLAAHTWRTNGALIADVATLYLDPSWTILDPTFGRGLWWTDWQPAHLVTHDLGLDGVDFRHLPEPDTTFDAVAFDPPYVAMGGRDTSKLPDFMDRFGLRDAPRTPAQLQAHNDEGLAEVHRVLKAKGVALVKCQDYVSSGRLFPGTHLTLTAALGLGFTLVDRFEHIGHKRAQPGNRTRKGPNGERIPSGQVHARRNLSTLLVLGKG